MKKVLVICPFPHNAAAGQRLKYEQYFGYWRENGFDPEISSFMDNKMWEVVYKPKNYTVKVLGTLHGYLRRIRDLFRLQRFDMVYVFMWVTPFGSAFFERLYRLLSKKLIYDIEDNVLMERSNNVNPIVKILRSPTKTEHLVKSADHVITSSPFLNNHCLGINSKKSCTYISSSINTDSFIPKNSYLNDHKLVVGWTGTFSSKCYLDLLRDVFIELSNCCDFRLRIISNFEYEIPGVDLEVIQWTREKEVEDMQHIDIGVYPLDLDGWVLGKSGLKAIQYMAFGIPTIATNFGTTPMIIEHFVNGWLVKTRDDWLDALKTLIKDPALRRELGSAGRATVIKRYSQDVIKGEYLSILKKVNSADQ